MKTRDSIYEEIDVKYNLLLDDMTKLFIRELENKYGFKLGDDYNRNALIDLLFTDYCDDVIEFMVKHDFNRKEIMYNLIFNLCNSGVAHDLDYMDKINLFYQDFNFIKQKKKYMITSEDGKLEFRRFSDCVQGKDMIKRIKKREFIGQCHSVVEAFRFVFPNSYIVTSLMPGRFGGKYFHSYYNFPNNLIVDISCNGVFYEDEYYKYFSPQEIIRYPGLELDDRYSVLSEKTDDARVLQLALNQIQKKY